MRNVFKGPRPECYQTRLRNCRRLVFSLSIRVIIYDSNHIYELTLHYFSVSSLPSLSDLILDFLHNYRLHFDVYADHILLCLMVFSCTILRSITFEFFIILFHFGTPFIFHWACLFLQCIESIESNTLHHLQQCTIPVFPCVSIPLSLTVPKKMLGLQQLDSLLNCILSSGNGSENFGSLDVSQNSCVVRLGALCHKAVQAQCFEIFYLSPRYFTCWDVRIAQVQISLIQNTAMECTTVLPIAEIIWLNFNSGYSSWNYQLF